MYQLVRKDLTEKVKLISQPKKEVRPAEIAIPRETESHTGQGRRKFEEGRRMNSDKCYRMVT